MCARSSGKEKQSVKKQIDKNKSSRADGDDGGAYVDIITNITATSSCQSMVSVCEHRCRTIKAAVEQTHCRWLRLLVLHFIYKESENKSVITCIAYNEISQSTG